MNKQQLEKIAKELFSDDTSINIAAISDISDLVSIIADDYIEEKCDKFDDRLSCDVYLSHNSVKDVDQGSTENTDYGEEDQLSHTEDYRVTIIHKSKEISKIITDSEFYVAATSLTDAISVVLSKVNKTYESDKVYLRPQSDLFKAGAIVSYSDLVFRLEKVNIPKYSDNKNYCENEEITMSVNCEFPETHNATTFTIFNRLDGTGQSISLGLKDTLDLRDQLNKYIKEYRLKLWQ